jgi:tetratricopeptide (TPR) repeat protein
MASPNDNTIYLTEQEAERIRSVVKNRVKLCSEKAGNAREPREKLAAHQQATGAALMADMGGAPDPDMTQTQGKSASTIPALAVGQPYPPCTASLDDLEPMKLADLKMETHHRGRKLLVKRESPVVTLVARSWTMVQDQDGEGAERLEMCLHKTRHGEDVLESVKSFVIKEPYFTLTDQGEATLRIDHPSDLVLCYQEAKGKDTEDAEAAEKIATRCKTQGNTALKQQDLPLAYAKYSEGLEVAERDILADSKPDLARDISRNRAYVNLLLSQHDEAITDAHASLTGREDQRSKDLDSKAYYRAGCAAYNLGKWAQAKRFFEGQQKQTPDDKDAKLYLKKIEQRLTEQDSGSYDLMKIRSSLSRARPRVDAATFTRNTQIKDSPGRGRGLYATRDIRVGELVMCEKAFCVVWGHEEDSLTAMTYDLRDDRIRVSPVGLSKAIVQKLLSNPSQIPPVMGLYGDYQGEDGKNETENDEGAIVDVFRVHDIMSRNAFGPGSQYGEEGARNASTGLWIHAAYINHSCVPNAKKEYTGDLMVLRATKPIKTGEEIFHSYDESLDYEVRQKALMTTWGFECHCELCDAEKADGQAVRDKRMELVGEADAFVERTPWAGAKRLAIRKAQRLVQAMDETYDEQRYKELPRRHGESIRAWLSKASPR